MESAKNVLWTGGWDSTFRIIQLYQRDALIQPIYVIDHKRVSAERELEVIHRLSEKIPLKFDKSKGNILPLILIKRKDIPSNPFLKFMYKRLKKEVNLGKQYYWLASVGKKYKELDMSFHLEDMDRFFSMDQLIEINDEKLGVNWRINSKKLDFYRTQLFKNMRFPLCTTSKPQMKSIAAADGYIDLMESTWFCLKSKDNPCGKCNPCKQYIRDGFGYRLE